MRAGTMIDRITLLAMVPTTDARWGPGSTPQTVATVWAEVLPLEGTKAGNEQFDAQGVQAFNTYIINIRYRDGIAPDNQITWEGRTLQILSVVDPDSCRATLQIIARDYPMTTGGAA